MIYFDNAATTFPKPPAVAEAVKEAVLRYGGNPGRGAHRVALQTGEKIYECRMALSRFLDVGAPERIIFTENTTHALNLAIKGLLKEGDHVLISDLEHNAVLRPLYALRKGGVTFDVFATNRKNATEILAEIERKVTKKTTAILCTHASNICSRSLPLAHIGAFCRRRGLWFIVDAAQSAGHLPLHMNAMHIDALALPGHKGLFGITGCGVLALAEHCRPKTLMEGGSGLHSKLPVMPNDLPERYEAGTLPVAAILSLKSGIEFVENLGLPAIEKAEKTLFLAARERIESVGGYEIYEKECEGPVLLFRKQGMSAESLARHLDKEGICVRAGLHCAPLAHKTLGTPEDGAVRLSFSPLNTPAETDALWQALRTLI